LPGARSEERPDGSVVKGEAMRRINEGSRMKKV
jgi:hypothetical protein